MRVFLALPIPPTVRDQLARTGKAMQALGVRGRFVTPGNLHVTVLFVGELGPSAASSLTAVVGACMPSCAPFVLSPAGLACFGRPPKVLHFSWRSRGESFEKLVVLLREAALEAGIAMSGSSSARRPMPHVTLVRFRRLSESRTLGRVGNTHGRSFRPADEVALALPKDPVLVDRLLLFQSTLHPHGAIYSELAEFRLGTGES